MVEALRHDDVNDMLDALQSLLPQYVCDATLQHVAETVLKFSARYG